MTTTVVIPARYASTRLPGKPLIKETGKYLIQHVWERVRQCSKVDRVIVATDDERVASAVRSIGGTAQMTRNDHTSGTARVGEVASTLDLHDDDLVLNVQGDEPEISPGALERLIEAMAVETRKPGKEKTQKHRGVEDVKPAIHNVRWVSDPPYTPKSAIGDACRIGTLAARFADDGPRDGPGSPLDPNCVKVVVDAAGRAMYFSRSLVPYPRETGGAVDKPSRWWLHLGVYAFRADALRAITKMKDGVGTRTFHPSSFILHPCDAEALEQLGWLELGFSIAVVGVEHAFVGIDTPDEYAGFVKRTRKDDG